MFTGLIREMAEVVSFNNNTLRLRAKYKAQIGDSIAVNGACLTVVKVYDNGFSVELSPESQKILAIQNYKGKVHIEPAMSMGDRHIDTVGSIQKIVASDNSYDFYIEIDERFISFVVPKGSITVDGVSLTHIIQHQEKTVSWAQIDKISALY